MARWWKAGGGLIWLLRELSSWPLWRKVSIEGKDMTSKVSVEEGCLEKDVVEKERLLEMYLRLVFNDWKLRFARMRRGKHV